MNRALGMAFYGVFVISMIDNIVKPIILRGSAQIHMMLGFLSILGGLLAFGPKGLIVGPVVLSLVLSGIPDLPLRRPAVARRGKHGRDDHGRAAAAQARDRGSRGRARCLANPLSPKRCASRPCARRLARERGLVLVFPTVAKPRGP